MQRSLYHTHAVVATMLTDVIQAQAVVPNLSVADMVNLATGRPFLYAYMGTAS